MFKLKILKGSSYIIPWWAAQKAAQLFLTPKKYKRPQTEVGWYEKAIKRFLKSGLVINEWNPDGNKKVLLVHGWEGRGSQMGAFAEPLVQKGYHVIALDGPAHGDSPGQKLNAGVYSQSLVDVQNEMGSIDTVIAHSFGGGCSIIACHKGLQLNKLVIIASPSDYYWVIRSFLDFINLSAWAEKKFFRLLEKESKLKFDQLNIAELGTQVQSKILLVHDKNDKDVPVHNAYVMNSYWPDHSELYITEGLGHRRILKDQDVVQKVTEFIIKEKMD